MNDRQDKARAGMLLGVQAGRLQVKLDKRLATDAAQQGCHYKCPHCGQTITHR